jgi:hypothetical protein
MYNQDIPASRGFMNDSQEAGFFIDRTKNGIILEIDLHNRIDSGKHDGEVSLRIPLTKAALKELAIMFQVASEEEYPNDTKGLDKV